MGGGESLVFITQKVGVIKRGEGSYKYSELGRKNVLRVDPFQRVVGGEWGVRGDGKQFRTHVDLRWGVSVIQNSGEWGSL